MRSTGEVMGIDLTFGLAFAKSQMAAGGPAARVRLGVPLAGRPGQAGGPARRPCGSPSSASRSPRPPARRPTSRQRGVPVDDDRGQGRIRRHGVDAVELIRSGKVQLVVNTPAGGGPVPTVLTSAEPPTCAQVACLTTVAAARAAARRHRRLGRPPPVGAQPAGVPPARRPAVRSRWTACDPARRHVCVRRCTVTVIHARGAGSWSSPPSRFGPRPRGVASCPIR